ncbi:MAG: hypothetical protein JST05_03955 [Acidobacteria bacterium]|nr:hypothetical protein [Acidobacteriota bacterium]
MPFFPPALQTPAPAQAPAPKTAPTAAKADLPPGFRPGFRFVVRPWGREDLGSVGPREKVQRTWKLENLSDAPIAFQVADLSPGVIVMGDPFKAPIPAHGTREFTIQTDATDWEGYQRRAIRLVSDDPKQPTYKVLWEMTVRPDLTVDATTKKLRGVAPYESPQAVFAFKRETGDPLELKLASKLPPYVDSEIVSKGASAELRLTLRAAQVPPGQLEGLEIAKVTTNAPKQPTFDLYLDWSLKLPVTPTPSRVVFDDPKIRDMNLALRGDKPFRIASADLKAEGFELGPVPKGKAQSQTIRLHRTSDAAKDGLLTLTFEGLEDPLKIPVIWADPRKR